MKNLLNKALLLKKVTHLKSRKRTQILMIRDIIKLGNKEPLWPKRFTLRPPKLINTDVIKQRSDISLPTPFTKGDSTTNGIQRNIKVPLRSTKTFLRLANRLKNRKSLTLLLPPLKARSHLRLGFKGRRRTRLYHLKWNLERQKKREQYKP